MAGRAATPYDEKDTGAFPGRSKNRPGNKEHTA